MPDQAASLRELSAGLSGKRAKVVTFASGKGGVGKSNLIINSAIALAGTGAKVGVLDMDLGLANLDILLGLSPRYTLTHVMAGAKRMVDIIHPGPNNVLFIPGASGVNRLANLNQEERTFLIECFTELEEMTDLLLVDTGAGISDNVIQFALSSNALVVVTTPEPTARMDAYALIKTVHRSSEGKIPIQLLVNQARRIHEGEAVFNNLASVCMTHLNIRLELLGIIPKDQAIPSAVHNRRPFLLHAPKSSAALATQRVARKMQEMFLPDGSLQQKPVQEGHSFFSRFFSLFSRGKTA